MRSVLTKGRIPRRGCFAIGRAALSEAPSSTSYEKMAEDKRYKPETEVPDHVLKQMKSSEVFSPGFSIQGQALEGRASYLDMQATTPLDPRVLDAMMPHMMERYGNPHSRTHIYGWESEKVVEDARQNIADLIGASSKEIIFTSGATESNNMSIKGKSIIEPETYSFYRKRKSHLITTQTEHKCVLDSCRAMEQEGFEVTYLPVDHNGLIDLEELDAAIRPETALVSVMAVNNEIGVIQSMEDIGKICRKHKVFFHTDAAQMLGKLPINVDDMNIDLMSLSSHKIYGPKGVGALYVRRRPRVRLEPIFSGGGQERGLRSGTLAHSLCVGFGEACKVAGQEMANDEAWVRELSDRMYNAVMERIPHVTLNGDLHARYAGNLNLSFAFVEGESLLMALKNIAVSSGSACTSASLEPSYVLRAIGVDEENAHTSMRFGIGRFTTKEEVDFAVDLLEHHVKRLREMSPLYEMVCEGKYCKHTSYNRGTILRERGRTKSSL
ncbi:unnamed protein product [Chrysoparadoxa australica]